MDKFSSLSKKFYLVILGLTIPFYLLLYGASGHRFDPPTEDIAWMVVVVLAFVSMITYLRLKKKSGFAKGLVAVTLMLTGFGGLWTLLFMLQFEYGDDTGFVF